MTRSFRKFLVRLDGAGMRAKIERLALVHYVTLRELYEGKDLAPSIVAARRSVYSWLVKEGKSVNEVARLFDRAPNGVWKMTRKS